ncbi:MAG TPA: DNA alkylation repair protein [Thermomonospora sp.]|nr:DNA alkylation repair protein [Thermomonospora sp.]
MATEPTAERFTERLEELATPEQRREIRRYFKAGEADDFLGVRMSQVFTLAKEFLDMPLSEVERLLVSPVHEARAGALSIMDKQARRKRTPETRRRELYDLYLRHLDHIDNWDLVDLAAPHVVGGYLYDKPRDVLYELAGSQNVWARRTAVYSTLYFARQNDLDDVFGIAETLLADEHDLIQKAVGTMLREAGRKDRPRLLAFLDEHAPAMPRIMLRYAIEHLDKEVRDHYRGLKTA